MIRLYANKSPRPCCWSNDQLHKRYSEARRAQDWKLANALGNEIDQRSDAAAGR